PNEPVPRAICTLSLHDALPICEHALDNRGIKRCDVEAATQKLGLMLCRAQLSRASMVLTYGSLLTCTIRELSLLSLTTIGRGPLRASFGIRYRLPVPNST